MTPQDLAYYVERATKTLFAFGSRYEFFKIFQAGAWKTSPISFSQFLHDYESEQITAEEAARLTGGVLPVEEYARYCEAFDR